MRKKDYSQSIVDIIGSFLEEDNWKSTFDEQKGIFLFSLNLNGKIKRIQYQLEVTENDYLVYVFSPIGADTEDEKMKEVLAEFICRANYGLKNGNFEIDMNDSEIRFKIFVSCDGILPSREVVRRSIYTPALIFNRYSEGITDIIFKNASAKEAIAKCEESFYDELLESFGEEEEESDSLESLDQVIARRARIGRYLRMAMNESEEADEDDDEGEEFEEADGDDKKETDSVFGIAGDETAKLSSENNESAYRTSFGEEGVEDDEEDEDENENGSGSGKASGEAFMVKTDLFSHRS